MRFRNAMIVTAVAVALGLTATVLGHPGAASAAAKTSAHHAPVATRHVRPTDVAHATLPPIRHVFVIVLENESASTTFPASGPAPAPYLADTMTSEGAFLPNYYATGHNSNDNYISMISGQAPNADNSDDCLVYGNFPADLTTGAPYDQQEGVGCIYPSDIPNIASQLDGAGDSWRDYNQDMGNVPTREAAECGHPAVGSQDGTQTETTGDAYATRHNPFVYFHDIIDNTTLCDTHVVNLSQLSTDLQSAATTPNYVYITPDLCGDGHDDDSECEGDDNGPGGFDGINAFLSQYVPMITNSPAFKDENGLLITTFDEASTSDTSSCCGEIAGPGEPEPGLTGTGGGRVGAVLISPCITPGTVSDVDYNHYSMLGSVENIFGLPHLGYAQLPGENDFGSDIFNRSCDQAPTLTLKPPVIREGRGTAAEVPLSYISSASDATYDIQVRQLLGARATAWRTLASDVSQTSYGYRGVAGATYQFRVQATDGLGVTSPYATTTVTVPTGPRPVGTRLTGHWRYVTDAGAAHGHAEAGTRGARYSYTYSGGALQLLATRLPGGGQIEVVLDGVAHRVDLHSSIRQADEPVLSLPARSGRHTLRLTVLSGTAEIEGLVISDLG